MPKLLTILLCEEDEGTARMLSNICRIKAPGCIVLSAPDGTNAMMAISRNDLLDLIVFGTIESGPGMITAIRRAAEKFNGIVISASHNKPAVRIEQVEAGCTEEVGPKALIGALPHWIENALNA